ncbi:MAG: hypothetical protein ACOX2O_04175 [Bdellovibrionota bacterium]|jgi:hypothetical protein
MLLAYMHCFGVESDCHDLCLVADKPDQFSCPVRVVTLRETTAAVYRLGPQECVNIDLDRNDNGLVITPLYPANLFLTPDLPTYPGMKTKKIKIFQNQNGDFTVYYLPEVDIDGSWKEWIPNREKRAATHL